MKTIEEVRNAKKELRNKLEELVDAFEKENEVVIDSITIATNKETIPGTKIEVAYKEYSINIKI